MIDCVLDFETASGTDLKKAGAWRYSECPTTEVISLAYALQNAPTELWTPDKPVKPSRLIELARASEIMFVSHGDFDKAMWRNVMVPVHGFPDVPNSRWHSTMAVCAMKMVPQDLERALQVLGLPHEKDTEGSKLTIALSKPDRKGRYPERTPQYMERVYAYNRSDIRGTVALHQRLGPLPPAERNVWLLDQRINERGVRFDLPLVQAARDVVDRASVPLLAEFSQLTSGLKVASPKFRDWCEAQGWFLPDMRKETVAAALGRSIDEGDDEDDYQSLAGDDYGDTSDPSTTRQLPENVRRALEIRQLVGSASVKKLARIEQCVCADGRIRGLLQYHGTSPGLWAGRLVQPQNFPRPILKVNGRAPTPDQVVDALMTRDPQWVEDMLGHDGTRPLGAVEVVVSCLRNTIIPDPDRQLAVGDFAGIQARLTYALAGQYDKVELMRTGKAGAIYLDMAQRIYGREISKENDITEYTIGKSSVLGLGFQMGARKFHARYCPHLPFEFAERVVNIFRKEFAPEVPKLWWGLKDASTAAMWTGKPHSFNGIEYALRDGWLTCRLPSGRLMWYFNPQKIREPMPWDDTDVRPGWTYDAMKQGQFKTIKMFGGLATENVAMGMQRDLLVRAMFTCEREGLPMVLNVHDEAVTEPLRSVSDAATVLEQIMSDEPDWAKQLRVPVAVETWAGDRYRK